MVRTFHPNQNAIITQILSVYGFFNLLHSTPLKAIDNQIALLSDPNLDGNFTDSEGYPILALIVYSNFLYN